MAFFQYLIFDDVVLPLPESYNIDLSCVEADTTGTTEAGTTQRDVVRFGIVNISFLLKLHASLFSILSTPKD